MAHGNQRRVHGRNEQPLLWGACAGHADAAALLHGGNAVRAIENDLHVFDKMQSRALKVACQAVGAQCIRWRLRQQGGGRAASYILKSSPPGHVGKLTTQLHHCSQQQASHRLVVLACIRMLQTAPSTLTNLLPLLECTAPTSCGETSVPSLFISQLLGSAAEASGRKRSHSDSGSRVGVLSCG